MRLAMGVALLVIVSAEFVGARSGVGYLIWTSWQVFQVEKMYVGLLVTALLGFAGDRAYRGGRQRVGWGLKRSSSS